MNSFSARLKRRSFRVILAAGCLLLPAASLSGQTGPGGVGNNTSNRLWLKADFNVFRDLGVTPAVDGNQVQQWNDASGNNNNAFQNTSGNRPVYRINIINGFPALQFSGDNYMDPSALGIPGTGGFSIITVFKTNSYVAGGMSDGSGDYIIDRTVENNPLTSLKVASSNKYGFQKRNDAGNFLGGPVSSTSVSTTSFVLIDYMREHGVDYRLYLNGSFENSTADVDGNLTPPVPRIGRHAAFAGGGIKGYIAEVMIFNYRINYAQINIVNSYLAAKYGLTITNDKYSYKATHKYDVAGIGRVDASNLHTSATSAAILNVSDASALDDGEYLLFGHDNGSITAWNNEAPSGIAKIPREWKLSETGDVGTVSFTADLSSFPAPPVPACSKYVLLVDADGDFSAGATSYDLTLSGPNLYKVTGLSTIDGNYVSIGVRKAPTASITPDPAQMCVGSSINMNGNPTGGSGGYTHLWTGNTGPLSAVNIQNPVFATNTANTYNLTYTVTDNKGCSSNDVISVTVVPQPAITIPPGGATICSGGTHTMNVTAINGIPSLTYQWEESDDNGSGDAWANASGGSGSTTAAYTTPALIATRYYRVVVSAAGSGCSSATSGGAEVTVVQDPTIDTHPAGAVVCYNSVWPMSVTVNGGTALSYEWQVSPNGINSWSGVGTNSPDYTTSPITNTRYYRVTVTSTASGCTSPVVSNVATVSLENVAPAITGSIATATVQGCAAVDATPAVSTVADLEALGLNISDACTADGSLVVTHTDASSGVCPTVVTRTYRVADESGNVSAYDQIINVLDQIAPLITGSIPVTTVEGCAAGAAPAAVTTVSALEALGLNISDGCTVDASLVVDHTDATSGTCPIRVTRTYSVSDRCGNTSTYDQIINVADTKAPVVTGTLTDTPVEGCNIGAVPAAMTTVAGLEALAGGITITDDCTPDASLTVSHSDVSGGNCPIVITRTYTVADGCGNSKNITHIINVDDTQSPVVTGSLSAVNIEGCNIGSTPAALTTVAAIEALGGITINDACSPDAILTVTSKDTASGICPIVVTRTYKVADVCGNYVNILQTINIDDTQPPVVSGSLSAADVEGCNIGAIPAAETTVAGLESLPGGVTINDICTADPLMTVTHSDAPGVTACPLVIIRTYTVKDACLNSVNIIHTINIDDTQPPVITGTLSVTNVEGCGAGAAPAAETTVSGLESLTGGIGISDACSSDLLLSVSHNDVSSGSCPLTITRTYTVSDVCGNSADIVHTINIDDTQAPVIAGTLTALNVEGCSAADAPAPMTTVAGLETLAGSITITDACTADPALTVTHSDIQSGSCPIVITRTYTVTDDCLNSRNIIQTINIRDTQPPVVSGSLSTVSIEGCNIGAAPAAVTTVAALETLAGGILISDGCIPDASLTVSSTDDVANICPRVITRTYKVADACGNFVTITQTINIDDTQPPSVSGSLSDITAEGCDAASAPAAATTLAGLESLPGGVVVSDICTPGPSLRVTHSDSVTGSCPTVMTRTYTVTDACDNFVNLVQIINIDDTQAPSVTGTLSPVTVEGCNAGAAPAAVTTVADLEALDGGITVTDFCTAHSFLSVNHTDAIAGSCPLNITRTYTVTDACGNTADIIQLITVNDTKAPVIAGTFTTQTVEGCNGAAAPPAETTVAGLELLPGAVTITDDCTTDALLTVTHSDSQTGSCPIIITRTYTIMDECGNSANIVQTINVADTQAPVVAGSLTTLSLEGCHIGAAPAPATTVAEIELLTGNVSITDACTPDVALIVSHSDAVVSTCPIEITRTYTVKDACGNTADVVQTILINDTQPPVLTGLLLPVTVEGCTMSDAPAAEITVAGLEGLPGGIAISDICTNDESMSVTHSDAATGSCPLLVTRTYTITDACNNFVTISQAITVEDTTSPAVTGSLSTTNIEGCTLAEAPAAVTTVAQIEALTGDLTITDACTADAALTVTHSDAVSGTCPIVITRTYTVTDECGNFTDIVHTILVDDNTDPVIVGALSDITVEGCDAGDAPVAATTVAGLEALLGSIAVSDACTPDAALNVTHSDSFTGSCPVIITRTYTITDVCGNKVNIIQTIYVDDTLPPVITGSLSDVTVEGCDTGAAPAAVTTVSDLETLPGVITIADACTPDASLVVTYSDDVAGRCPIVITRTYTVTDGCGNSENIIQIINIDDTQPPVVTGSLNTTTIEGCDATVAPAAVTAATEIESLPGNLLISDGCTPDASLTVIHSDVITGFCPTVITRTYTVSDECGNSADIVHTINILDTQPPVVTGSLSPTSVEGCDASVAPAAVNSVASLEGLTGTLAISDICTPDASLIVGYSDVQSGSCPIVITRTYTVTDVCGNATTVVHKINIHDTTSPAFTVPADITIFKDPACGFDASIAITGDMTDQSDNCDISPDASFSDLVSNGSCTGEQIITRTWRLIDNCGNATTHKQIITVRDNIPPEFTVPPDLTIYKDAACGFNSGVSFTGDVTDESDNCDNTLEATFLDSVSDGSCTGEQIITRTWSLTDDCGNLTTHIQIITVGDNTPPTFTAPASIYVCRTSACGYVITPAVTGDVINESDNCSTGLNATYLDDISGAADCDKAGIVLRRWSLTDNCGNAAADQIQTIYINPLPSVIVTSTDALLCHSGESADFSISTSNTMTAGSLWQYDVSVVYPPGVTGSLSSGLTNQTTNSLSDNLINTTNIVQTVTYTFTPHIKPGDASSECLNGVPVILYTDLDPQPKIAVSTDPLLCHDGDATFIISTSNTTLHSGSFWRYDVNVSYPDGVTGDWTSGLTDQTVNTLTDNLTNNSDSVQTVTYTFTSHISPGDGGSECQNGEVKIVTVDLDPQPKMAVTTDALLCYDGDATFNISTVNAPLHIGSQWRYDVSVSYPAGVTGSWTSGLTNQTVSTLTDNLTNSSNLVQIVTYTFTPHIRPGDGGSECQNGVPVIITVELDPQPRIAVTTDQLLCYDGDAIFNISTVNATLHTGSLWRYDVGVAYPTGVTGSWEGGLLNQTANTLTDNLTNNSDIVQTVTYTFTPHIKPGDSGSECHSGIPVIITVDLDPQPKIAVTTHGLLCYDGDATLSISTVNATMHAGSLWRYDMSVSYPAGVTGSWGAGLTDQTAGTLTDNLTNGTAIVQTVTYTFTPHISPGDGGTECGSGVQVIVTVDLDPQPRIAVTTDPLICHDGDAIFNISTVNATLGTGSLWRYDVTAVYPAGVNGSWPSGLSNQISGSLTDNLTNNTNNVQTVTYTFTPHIKPGDGGTECQGGIPVIITVDLDPQPKITVTADQVLCYDGDATFNISTVNATLHGGSLWRYDVSVSYPAGVSGSWPAGLTDQTLNTLTDDLANSTAVVQTVTYTFTPHISPGDGGSECENGAAVILTVSLDPQPRIAVTTDQLLCHDGNATFNISTVNASLGTGSQWRYDVSVTYPAGVTGSWITGLTNQTAGSLTDDLTNNSDIVRTVTYTFTPHIKPGDGGAECQNGVPVTITLDLDPQPKITVTTDQLLCYDGDATFSISTVNAALHAGSLWRYDVSVSYPAGVTGSWASGLTDQIVNSLTDTLTNNTNIVQTLTYTFTPHIKPGDSGTECGNGLPVIITVALDPRPRIAVTTDALLCYDGDATFNISTVNSTLHGGSLWRYDVSVTYPAGVTGSWGTGLTDQTASSLTDNLTNTTNVVQTVSYTFTPHISPGDGGTECPNGIPVIITVDLDPQPGIAVSTDMLLCHDGDATFSISTLNAPLHAGSQWRYDVSVIYPAGVTGSWAAGLTGQTLNSLTDNLTNTTNVVQTVNYTFTPHIKPGDGGTECQNGIPAILTVYLDPQPRITVTTDNLLCYDGDATFNISNVHTLLGPGSLWRYDVSVSYPAGVTGTWASGLTNQTVNTLTDDLTNTTSLVQTVTYTFTPHIRPGDGGTECQNGVKVVISVDLDPQPRIAVTTDLLLCHDGDAKFNISTVNTALHAGSLWRYDVSVTYPAGVTGSWAGGLTNQTLTLLTDNLTNISDVIQTVTYTFTPHIGPGDSGTECQDGIPVIISVDLDPRPKMTVTTDPLLCFDGDATFNIATVNTALHTGSQWRYDVSVVYPAGVTGSWPAGLTDQSLTTLTDNLTNSTNLVQTVTYTFTPHINPGDGGTECRNGIPVIITVDLDPQPKIAVTTDALLCYDGDATFNISTVNATLYAGSLWRYDVSVTYPGGVTGSWAAGLTDQTASTLTDNLTNTSDVVQTVIYTFTPHIGPGDAGTECRNGIPVIISVDLDPQPKIAVATDMLLCYDGDAVFNISTVNSTLHTGSQWRYDVSVNYPAGVTGSWAAGLTNQTLSSLTDNLTNNTNIVQTISYTFNPHIKPGDGGTECGNGVPFNLTVYLDPRPKITVTADQLLCFDGDATFNISNVHTLLGPGSQWRYDVSVTYPAGVTGDWASGLTDQTANTLTDNLTSNSNVLQTVTYTFTPHIRPGDGGSVCRNGVPVIITVDLDPQPKIAVTTDALLCYDGDATFNISTVNATLHTGSQWRYDVSVSYPAGVTGSWAAGLTNQTAGALTDNLTNSSNLVQIVTYTFTPHIRPGDGGSECQNGVPVIITVELDPQPRIAVTTDQLLCYDGDAIFNISTVNATLHTGSLWRYDVSVAYPSGVTGSWAGGLTDQTSNTLTDNLTNNTSIVQTVTYTFTPHIKPGDSGSECHSGIPVIITVDLDPQPKIAVTTDALLCYDGDATFDISTVNATMHAGSLWRYNVSVSYPAGVAGSWGAGLTDQTAGTLTDNLTNGTDIVQTVTYTFTPHIRPGDGGTECGSGIPVIVTVHIDPQPKITVVTSPVLCFDGDATFNISTVNIPLYTGSLWRYDVSVSYPAGVTGSWAAGLINRTENTITDNLTNTGDVVQTVVYTFTPHIKPGDGGSECQNGVQVIVNVRIDPQPRLFPIPPNTIQCDSTLTNIVLQSPNIFSSGFITFDQTVSGDGTINGYSTIPVNGLPNSHVIADRLVNQTDVYHSITYTIVPVSPTGCLSGTAVDIVVTVNPTPRVIPLNTNLKRDSSICYGGTTRVALTSPTVMTSGSIRFDYTVSLTGGGTLTGNSAPEVDRIPGYTISYPYQNSSDTLQSVFYNITPKVDNAICVPGRTVRSEIKVHARPLQSLLITKPLTCNGGSDAELQAIPSKGAGLYYFNWVRPGTDHIAGYGIDRLANIKGGRWEVTVTDNLGCSNSNFVIVAGAYFDSYLYVVDTTGFGTTCNGSNDGEIWIKEKSSSTGIPPFEYWLVRNGVDTVRHSTLPATEVLEKLYNLKPGTYRLIMTDANHCVNLNYPDAEITEPDKIEVTLFSPKTPAGYNITCKGYNDGSAAVTTGPTGGNGGYKFRWTTSDGLITGADTLNTLDGLIAGTYYLQITDRKGCIGIDSITLTEPDGMVLTGSELHYAADGVYNISCQGGSDGSIKLTISGGSGNYLYSWSGPGGYSSNLRDISGLKAGTYVCTVTDVNGCILTPSPLFNLTEPPLLTIASSLSVSTDGSYNINCFGGTGSADITVAGGIPGTYLYYWSTADGSGLIAAQEDQPALTAGSYHLRVTDQNNCEQSIDFTLIQPDPVIISFSVNDITCQAPGFDNGSIDLTVSGGISPFNFVWSDGSTTEDIAGLTEGYYKVTVTDANGCSKADSVRVNLPPPLAYSKSVSDYNGYQISCHGLADGYININPTTGEPPYSYLWSGPGGFSSTSNEISGLASGQYVLNITDNNFCTATETFDLAEPGTIGITASVSSSIAGGYNINCAGSYTGSIELEVVNAAGTVNYIWSDGITGQPRYELAAGEYRVIISDANNCHGDTTIILTQPDSIKLEYEITQPFCPDKPDGQIILNVSGGVPGAGYSFIWSDNSTGNNLSNIPAGRYTVSVSDLNGCLANGSVNVEAINETCLMIPEAISPNADGKNDVWNIGLIELYPDVEITIYNRWGESIWKSARGYPQPWNGRSNGRDLPMDSYHYIIDLNNGSKPIIGNVTIVR